MDEAIKRSIGMHDPSTSEPGQTPPAVDADMGSFVEFEGEVWYEIRDVDRLPTFLIALASDSDNWMFVTSRGGLTAGRVDPDGAIFPYETVDKLERSHLHTGPVTIVRLLESGGDRLWEPLSASTRLVPTIERRLRRNVVGNRLIFEETNRELGLTFSYRWTATKEFGWVRRVTIANKIRKERRLSVLDGLRNVQPFGAPLALYQQSSSLVDAYKRTDIDEASGLAAFSLTSRIVDRAEASEVLRANIVWSQGLPGRTVSVSEESLIRFRRFGEVESESVLTGRPGNYFLSGLLELGSAGSDKGQAAWHVVTDAGKSQAEVSHLSARLRESGSRLADDLCVAEREATDGLRRLVATADGNQLTASASTSFHHFANVLYNTMRGGVFADQGRIEWNRFRSFVELRNSTIPRADLESLRAALALVDENEGAAQAEDSPSASGASQLVEASALRKAAEEVGSVDLQRLVLEYLPIFFGRRHGDPSRPWNRFSIRLKDAQGQRVLRYQGNWRDVFQNWEALSFSFPEYIPHLVAKFVNASTVDGFNPYRLTSEGVDWEKVDPRDPWSYIGYWGDHQIIYLLKLLEAMSRFQPGYLGSMLGQEVFSFADVPYRIRPFESLLADPHQTIDYDETHAELVASREAEKGADGKLVHDADGNVVHAGLLEKLLIPVLSKISNLVVDGGIWMNTQRPEWNDANNALAGNGLSVVTLCYLRRFLSFLRQELATVSVVESYAIHIEVLDWMEEVRAVLEPRRSQLGAGELTETQRLEILTGLGRAFSNYRKKVYTHGLSTKSSCRIEALIRFVDLAEAFVDHSIGTNRREDGFFHAYNLLHIAGGAGARIERLYEMLEGQVAVLSSGLLSPSESLGLIERLWQSPLYRDDQRSFMLYPERTLPSFFERGRVPREQALAIPLLAAMDEAGDRRLMARDAGGDFRFHGDVGSADDVARILAELGEDERWTSMLDADRSQVLDLFESVFRHHSFTGRSGAMYAYEGLGSIYWHMVAKLLLAVQEITFAALSSPGTDQEVGAGLVDAYYRIRSGLGFEKRVQDYGAIPTDPYSHTPSGRGAQQPGMTGQVKEEVLTRLGELGVEIEDGRLGFHPQLLRRSEFLTEERTFEHIHVDGTMERIELSPGELAFTFAQVPVVYQLREEERPPVRLTAEDSRSIFNRNGRLRRIVVGVRPESLLP